MQNELVSSSLIEEVVPPVLVKHHYTSKKRQFSRNTYYDPESGDRYYEDDLTALELGRVVTYKVLGSAGGSVAVHLPYMVMDSSLGREILALKLKSFLCSKPFVGQTRATVTSESHRKSVTMCAKDFQVSSSDWELLQGRLASAGFIVRKDELDEEKLSSEIDEILTAVQNMCSLIRTNRKAVSEATSVEDVDQLTTAYHLVTEQSLDLARRPLAIGRSLQAAGTDPEEQLKVVRLEAKLAVLREAITAARQLNVPRLVREAVHKKAVLLGEEATVKVVGSLEEELSYLRHHFKPLRFVRGDKEDLVIDLSGVTIRITPESIKLEGDIAALRPYASGVALNNGDSMPSRFSSLRVMDKEDM